MVKKYILLAGLVGFSASIASSSIDLATLSIQSNVDQLLASNDKAAHLPMVQAKIKLLQLAQETNLINQTAPAYLGLQSDMARLAPALGYRTINEFAHEKPNITKAQKRCVKYINRMGIETKLTPSEQLLIWEQKEIKDNLLSDYLDTYSNLEETLNMVLHKEKEFNQNGYFTFYHGFQSWLYALCYLNTKLHEKCANIQTNNYLKLRNPDPNYIPPQDQDAIRTDRIKNRPWASDYHGFCTNHAITGNFDRRGSSSLHYFLTNGNASNPTLNTRLVFAQYGLESLYDTHHEAINKALNFNPGNGILLQLALKPNVIKKTTYNCFNMKIDNRTTTDVVAFLNALQKKPLNALSPDRSLDNIEWRIVLTDDLLLNPTSAEVQNGDFQVIPYCLDPQKLADFHKKIDDLVDELVAQAHNQNIAMAIKQPADFITPTNTQSPAPRTILGSIRNGFDRYAKSVCTDKNGYPREANDYIVNIISSALIAINMKLINFISIYDARRTAAKNNDPVLIKNIESIYQMNNNFINDSMKFMMLIYIANTLICDTYVHGSNGIIGRSYTAIKSAGAKTKQFVANKYRQFKRWAFTPRSAQQQGF